MMKDIGCGTFKGGPSLGLSYPRFAQDGYQCGPTKNRKLNNFMRLRLKIPVILLKIQYF